jgi:hypothetical protein
MKQLFLAVILTFVGATLSAQSKQDEVDLKHIKQFYARLKENKLDTKKELIWFFNYSDTSQTKLAALATLLESEGLIKEDLKKSKYEQKKYVLTVSEIKQYSPEALNERMHHLNDIAKQNNIMDYLAVYNADRPTKEAGLDKYKPVGKKTN